MKARIEKATGLGQHRLSIEPGSPGHGQSSVIHRLTQLTEGGSATSAAGALHLEHAANGFHNAGGIRHDRVFQRRTERNRRFPAAQPRDRAVQIVKALLRHRRGDFRSEAGKYRRFLHNRAGGGSWRPIPDGIRCPTGESNAGRLPQRRRASSPECSRLRATSSCHNRGGNNGNVLTRPFDLGFAQGTRCSPSGTGLCRCIASCARSR